MRYKKKWKILGKFLEYEQKLHKDNIKHGFEDPCRYFLEQTNHIISTMDKIDKDKRFAKMENRCYYKPEPIEGEEQ